MSDTTKTRMTDKDEVTQELVDAVDHKLKVLDLLVEHCEETYKNLKENKVPQEELDKFSISPNVYAINPFILADMKRQAELKTSLPIDYILDIYIDWMTQASAILVVNMTNYHKNKKLREHVNETLSVLIPNAKNALKKGHEFHSKCSIYLSMLAAKRNQDN
jgi:hypothetical protein